MEKDHVTLPPKLPTERSFGLFFAAILTGFSVYWLVTANSVAASDKEIALTCHAASEAQAPADRTRLLQLFQTLLHHAINSSASGSRISVRSKLHDGNVQVEITGSGLELSAEDLSNVFAPWRNGSGLGLFIGKGIVEAHGGQIACSSQPGAGTTFQVSLPLTPPRA